MLWTWDGKPLRSTKQAEPFTSVFKSGIAAAGASPTLADLDGDGAAEIIAWDDATCTIRAWHADGRGVGADDGILARLPQAKCEGGVTVGDLGGDSVMDLFVATWWVQRERDGTVRVVNMLPEPHWVQPGKQDTVAATNVLANAPPTSTQCTITDLDGDGNADILFGLVDGRLIVYPTRKAYRAEWMEWPTQNANVRHTGCWLPRDKRPPEAPRRRPGTAKGHL
jgi:hypothetical protein